MVMDRTRLAPAYLRGVRNIPLAGKGKLRRVRSVILASARVAARLEREVSMESCLVAMSTTRGDGLPGREP